MKFFKNLKLGFKQFWINLKFLCNKGLYSEFNYLNEYNKNLEDRFIGDYDDLKVGLKEFISEFEDKIKSLDNKLEGAKKNIRQKTSNSDFDKFKAEVVSNLLKLNNKISTEKRRTTRQTNEQNKEKRAFLKLLSKSESEFKKVIAKC